MKRLLLLFIPLMFFFGCEEEGLETNYDCSSDGCIESDSGQYATIEACESICDCFCGEVLQIEEGNPSPWPGGMQYHPMLDDSVYVEPYDGYQMFWIVNYCSGNTASGCYDWLIGNDSLSVGDSYCMQWSNHAWGQIMSFEDGEWTESYGCIGDSVLPFNEF